ncbi:MAG: hypothetical protein AABW67_06435 [Nanoarchaeota archaeon]
MKIHKSLKRKQKKKYLMQKRGQIETVAIILIILTTLGISVTAIYNSSPLYLGNSATHKYFDYHKCSELIKSIEQSNVVSFKTKDEAEIQNYNVTEGCV